MFWAVVVELHKQRMVGMLLYEQLRVSSERGERCAVAVFVCFGGVSPVSRITGCEVELWSALGG